MAFITVLFFMVLGLFTSVPALSIPRAASLFGECCFYLSAVGEMTGPVLQDNTGGNRLGGTSAQESFCLSNGNLTDSLSHTCGINEDAFSCTTELPTSQRYTLAADNTLLYDGCSKWFACPDPINDGSFIIESETAKNTTDLGCKKIQLQAGAFDCAARGTPTITPAAAAPSTSAAVASMTAISASFTAEIPPSTASPAVPSSTAFCDPTLANNHYVSPKSIIEVSSGSPEIVFPSQKSAYIDAQNSSIITFDIPAEFSAFGGYCALFFEFPYGNEATTPYNFTGTEEETGENGGLDFALLDRNPNDNTTFSNMPSISTDYGKTVIIPGDVYTIQANFKCQAGTTVSYLVSSVGDVGLSFVNDDGKAGGKKALGLFVSHCT